MKKVFYRLRLPLILLSGLIIRLLIIKISVYEPDLLSYFEWSSYLARFGPDHFYTVTNSDYTPGYLYILWLAGKVFYWVLNHNLYHDVLTFYKLAPISFDLFNAVLIYKIVAKIKSVNLALWAAFIYLFLPPVITISTLWGQSDGVVFTFLLLSIYLMISGQGILSFTVLGIGESFKPVAVVILPFLLIYLYKKTGLARCIWGLSIFLIVFAMAFIPFIGDQGLLPFISQRLTDTTTRYSRTTISSFNFWALSIGFNGKDMNPGYITKTSVGLDQRQIGYLLFLLVFISLLIFLVRKQKITGIELIGACALSLWAMFLLFTGMHERHFYYGSILAFAYLFLKKDRSFWLWIPIVIIFWLNLVYEYTRVFGTQNILQSEIAVITLSMLNIALFIIVLGLFLYEGKTKLQSKSQSVAEAVFKKI